MKQQSSVFVKRGDQVIGPMSWAKAIALAKQRKLQKADLIGPESVGPWMAAEAALSDYLKIPVAAVVQVEATPSQRPALSPQLADAVLQRTAPSISARAMLVSLMTTCAILATGAALVAKRRSSAAGETETALNRPSAAYRSNVLPEQGIGGDEPELAASEVPEPGVSESNSESQASEWTEAEPDQPQTSISIEKIEDLNKLLDRFNQNGEARNEPPSGATADVVHGSRARPRPQAIYKRALQLIRGEGITKDVPLGFKRMERAAELGHVEAMKFVSVMYHEGMGTAVDFGASAYWMLKAAEAGDAEAMWGLSNMYWKGEGVEQDERIAVYWVQRSAALKHQPAVEWLVEYKTVSVLNLFAGGSRSADEDGQAYADRSEAQRRVSREYWESRAQREAAAGDYQAAEASRRMNQ